MVIKLEYREWIWLFMDLLQQSMIIFTGHASNNAKKRWREKFKKKHPEGAKAFARFKRKLRLEKRLKKHEAILSFVW